MSTNFQANSSRYADTKAGREVQKQLLAAVPALRGYAVALCRDADRADDLVQDTLVRALAALDRFDPETCLNAWLFTIMRNRFRSEYRKNRRMVEDPDGAYATKLTSAPAQDAGLDLEDFFAVLGQISAEQRDAVMMVGASGMSYEAAAEAAGVPVGTIKSRVNRARDRLCQLLGVGSVEDLGPDRLTRAALQMAA